MRFRDSLFTNLVGNIEVSVNSSCCTFVGSKHKQVFVADIHILDLVCVTSGHSKFNIRYRGAVIFKLNRQDIFHGNDFYSVVQDI